MICEKETKNTQWRRDVSFRNSVENSVYIHMPKYGTGLLYHVQKKKKMVTKWLDMWLTAAVLAPEWLRPDRERGEEGVNL